MSDEATSRSGKKWLYVGGILVGLPLVYVLSTGPVAVLAQRGLIPDSSIEVVYQPLDWVMRTTGMNGDALLSPYIMAWFRLTGTPLPTFELKGF